MLILIFRMNHACSICINDPNRSNPLLICDRLSHYLSVPLSPYKLKLLPTILPNIQMYIERYPDILILISVYKEQVG